MNRHLKRGLIAGSIVSALVALAGALNIFFDPPVDVPSVGYFAYWMLVKAVLVIGVGCGLTAFVFVASASWALNNTKKTLLIFGFLFLVSSLAFTTLVYLTKIKPTERDEGYSQGEIKCCAPHR